MAGSPVKRARRAGLPIAVGHDGADLPALARPIIRSADLPAGWPDWSDAQRVRHLFGLALERVHDYLTLGPPDQLDAHQLASQREAMRLMIVTTREIAMSARREEERARVIEQIAAAVANTPARDAVVVAATRLDGLEPAAAIDDAMQHDSPGNVAEQRNNGGRKY
jgi:hypothetical protein